MAVGAPQLVSLDRQRGVTGYTIYRGGSMLTTVAGTSYEDSKRGRSTTYSYTIDAFDAAGNHSAQSSPASATTPQVWTSLGGTLSSTVAVSSSSGTRIDVFVKGSDNALYQKTWNGTSWSGWASLVASCPRIPPPSRRVQTA